MAKKYTREELEMMTVKDLRELCVYELGLRGLTKKPKDFIIDSILESFGSTASTSIEYSQKKEAPKVSRMTGVEFEGRSVLTKPGESFGFRTTTTIHVSCGASSGNFPVVGRTVLEVGEFLREVLNVEKLSTGLVNGKEVQASYILQAGDNLEFLKPAGKKGQ